MYCTDHSPMPLFFEQGFANGSVPFAFKSFEIQGAIRHAPGQPLHVIGLTAGKPAFGEFFQRGAGKPLRRWKGLQAYALRSETLE
jgi:hypothetical protein